MKYICPIRIGIIGTNFVSDWLAEAAAGLDCVEVTAVYSRAAHTGEAFAGKHQIPHVFCDYDAFLSSDVIDAVYIASPNFAHAEQAVRALNAGKHVLCEKVIATNSRELSEMIAAAKAQGVRFGRKPMERPEGYARLKAQWAAGNLSAREAARKLNITHQTFLRWVNHENG